VALVECLHVSLPDGAHGTGHRARLLGMEQQMYVVVHQHVGLNKDVIVRAYLAQEAPVMMSIIVIEEDRASVHPSLGDMHGNARQFDSGLTWHDTAPVGMPAVFAVSLTGDISEMPVRW
jgi:hypothetical protein